LQYLPQRVELEHQTANEHEMKKPCAIFLRLLQRRKS
jgi:hypothetical protein